jgi:hypothetical protein
MLKPLSCAFDYNRKHKGITVSIARKSLAGLMSSNHQVRCDAVP